MDISEMHYDFKKKLNKLDSQQYKNLLIPEIDWVLNEAQELFVKLVAKSRIKSFSGFELNQRSIDDIRTLVINNHLITIDNVNNKNVVSLPDNYWHFIGAEVEMTKGSCTGKARLHIRQHDDKFEESPFDKSSFEWRVVNGVFYDGGIKLYTDDTFVNTKVYIDYIKRPRYIHNAANFGNGTYNLPKSTTTTLSGTVNCELPEHTHREIVDIAVLIATGEIQAPDYNIKQEKLNFNHLR